MSYQIEFMLVIVVLKVKYLNFYKNKNYSMYTYSILVFTSYKSTYC